MRFSISTLFIIFNFFFLTTAFGQDLTVSGTLVDEKKTGIEASEVILLKNKKIVASALTDVNGNFTLSYPAGTYSLRFYYVGTIIYQTDFELNKNIQLGIISAFDSTNQLDEVELSSKKKIIENKVDRTVFNVENSVRASGSDALELLKSTPGVSVSSNSIGIVGKSTVNVMINDRVITMSGDQLNSYLGSISSDNIKSIEVITTPPAKYDAQGNSGLINIKLKNAQEDSWSSTIRGNYIQTTYPSVVSGANFLFNKNKWDFFIDLAQRKGSERITENTDTYYESETWIGKTRRKDEIDLYRGIVGIDFKATDKATIGIKYVGLTDKPDVADSNSSQVYDKSTGNLISTYQTTGYNNAENNHHTFNTYYIQKLDTIGRQFTIDLDYFTYEDDKIRNFSTQNFDIQNNPLSPAVKGLNGGLQNIQNYSGKIDFEIPTKWANYGFGGKLSWINNSSDIYYYDLSSGEAVLDIFQTNIFDYTENTQAAYVNFSKTLSPKWQTQIGLRYENTQVIGTTISPDTTQNQENKFDYDKLFPSAYLLYSHNENNSFSINYSKRINRPIFWDLNPFKWYLSSFITVEGNPYLQPSFADNVELNYTYKQNLSFKLYYSKTNNGNLQIPIIDITANPQTVEYIRGNFFDKEQYGLTISYQYIQFEWWESSNTLNGNYNDTSFTRDLPTEVQNGFQYAFYTNNTFTLNKAKSLLFEANFEYHSPRKELYFEATHFSKFDAGLRYSIKEKGWSFVLLGTDIFRDYMAYFDTTVNNTPQRRSLYMDERMLRIGVTYKFGNKKLVNNQRESGNEEVQGRLK
jgi:hypothetical protein